MSLLHVLAAKTDFIVNHFIVIVGVQVAHSILTLALGHSRVKIPLLGAVSLQTLSTGSP